MLSTNGGDCMSKDNSKINKKWSSTDQNNKDKYINTYPNGFFKLAGAGKELNLQVPKDCPPSPNDFDVKLMEEIFGTKN